eukprot:213604-Chlamydomonas_euryale.AAC.13
MSPNTCPGRVSASPCHFIHIAGHKDGTWSVDLPAEDVPPELPEPCLGINFARDGMQKRDWLALVAVHCDAWLMAVAFFYAVKLDAAGRWVGARYLAGLRSDDTILVTNWPARYDLARVGRAALRTPYHHKQLSRTSDL